MDAHHETHRIRSLVVAGSLFGLSIAIALGIVAGSGGPAWSGGLIALILGAPLVIALAATRFSQIGHWRAGWAVAAVLAVAIGITLATGVGIFYLALAAGFAWVVTASGRTRIRATAG